MQLPTLESQVIDGLTFNLTCMACPEQYDVYDGEKYIAYIRLRWGYLAVYPNVESDEIIYSYNWEDNPYKGCFEGSEREHHLPLIAKAIKEYHLHNRLVRGLE